MQIEIVSVSPVETKKTGKNSYEFINVTYKDFNGKIQAKKIVDFTHKDVFNVLKEASSKDLFEVESEKVNGFWEWTGIEARRGEESTSEKGTSPAVATAKWVPDEQKQRYIVRQNSLTNAVNFIINNKVSEAPSDVLEVLFVAECFEEWVYRTHNEVKVPQKTIAKQQPTGDVE